jgi:hypothetical protein
MGGKNIIVFFILISNEKMAANGGLATDGPKLLA